MEHKSNMCLILCGEIYMLNLDDALLFEADDHYTEIHNLYGNKIMVPFCLGEIEREIRTRFPDHNNLVRMGRKYIINKNRVFHMNALEADGVALRLQWAGGRTQCIETSAQKLDAGRA